MPAPFAQLSDVKALWGDLTAQQSSMVTVRLRQASAKIRSETNGVLVEGLTLMERVVSDGDFADVVKGICVDMVHRVLLNPRARLETSIDDGSARNDSSISTGALYISDDEFRELTGGRNKSSTAPQAFSITLGPGPRIPFRRMPSWRY